jgi:hypothetical protein
MKNDLNNNDLKDCIKDLEHARIQRCQENRGGLPASGLYDS